MRENVHVFAHGDGDGVICAAILKKNGITSGIQFSQPFLINKKNLDRKVIIADIAMDHSSNKTLAWAVENRSMIDQWFDHHPGSEPLQGILGNKFIFRETPSCAQVLREYGYRCSDEWIFAANALDSPVKYDPTELSERINSAIKCVIVRPNGNNANEITQLQMELVNELVFDKKSGLVTRKVNEYQYIYENTMKSAEELEEIKDGIFLVKLENGNKIDKTKLFVEGYKRNAKMVLIQHFNNDNPVTAIGTIEMDLLEHFGISSGCKNRIVINKKFNDRVFKNHEEQLEFILNSLN